MYMDAKKFRRLVRALLKKFPSSETHILKDQINRSCLSILLNTAEGSAKRSDKEFARFLETAIASVNEVVASFDLACDDGIITLEELSNIEQSASSIARQLGGFMKTLLLGGSEKLTVKSQRSIVRDFVAR